MSYRSTKKLIELMEKSGFIIRKKVSMADKISALERRLKEVKEKFDALKELGMNEELLIVYLQHKTKLSRKKVKEMLKETEEFFNKLVSKEVAEEL